MYAIIKTGGKQYKVAEGDTIYIEKLAAEDGSNVEFEAVMVVDGDKTTVGKPIVDGVKVKGKVVRSGRGQKIIVYKFKPKKNYRRKQGHRQPFTEVQITGIG